MEDLDEYRSKRDFSRTNEPEGKKAKAVESPIFVIQKHDASHLHYDLRLEVGGVLKSWAIPKGPSPDPSVKRMAVMVEDHPLEYAEFEGTIPRDEYGGGTVMVWDRGTYRNIRAEKRKPFDMTGSIEDGKVEVWLDGEKLRGGYVLVRLRSEKDWFLKKMKDEEAGRPEWDDAIENHSVKSGRTMDEIFYDSEKVTKE